jgi:hypothetical protein
MARNNQKRRAARAERPAEQESEPPAEQKPPPGRPWPKGTSGNPGGKPKVPPPVEPDPEGGVITAARMRKVLAQVEASDVGPTEAALRGWLDKDPKGFTGEIERRQRAEGADAEREAEVVRLRDRVQELEAVLQKASPAAAGPDRGTEAALAVVEKLLKEAVDA